MRRGRSRPCRQASRGKRRCFVNHPRLHVLRVRVEVPSARANKIIRDAQVDGLVRIQRADGDRRLIDRMHEPVVGFSEQGDGGDMVCHVGRHRVRYTLRRSIRYDIRGDEAHDGRALGESAEHHVGVGTVRRRRFDMCARVPNAVRGGGEVGGGGVVDRIHLDRLRADSRAQRVHKSLSGWTNTRWLRGTAREDHLDVGARLRGRGRNGCAQQRPTCYCRSTNEHGDMAFPHQAMLTYRDDVGDTNNQRLMNAA